MVHYPSLLKLTYYNVAVQHVIHYATEISPAYILDQSAGAIEYTNCISAEE